MKLEYCGNVKIRYIIKGKIVESSYHNEGLDALFKYIARALCGNNVSGDRPISLDLRKFKDGTYTSLLNTRSMLSGVYYTYEKGSWVTKTTAVISYSQLNTTGFDESDTYYIYLCSENNDFARLQVTATDLSRIHPGTQALIEWTLKVSNADASGEDFVYGELLTETWGT